MYSILYLREEVETAQPADDAVDFWQPPAFTTGLWTQSRTVQGMIGPSSLNSFQHRDFQSLSSLGDTHMEVDEVKITFE